MTGALDRLLLVREVEEFLFHEAQMLDEARFEEWMALFTEDGVYWVPSRPDQENALDTISIIHDDRRTMEARIRRLRHPAAYGQQPPSRTRHLIANVTVETEDAAGDEIVTRAGFLMLEHRDGAQTVYGGEVRHRLRRVDGAFRIARKRVDLVNVEGPHRPMSIPF